MITNHFNTVSPHSAERGSSLREVRLLPCLVYLAGHGKTLLETLLRNLHHRRSPCTAASQSHDHSEDLLPESPPQSQAGLKTRGVHWISNLQWVGQELMYQKMQHEPSLLSESATSTWWVPEVPDEERLRFSANFLLKSQGSTLCLFTSSTQLLLTVVATLSHNRLWRYDNFFEALTSKNFRLCSTFSNRIKECSLSPVYREQVALEKSKSGR